MDAGGRRLGTRLQMKIAALFGAALICFVPALAEACNRTVSHEATSLTVPAQRIDQSLLEDAIRHEVNFHRCRAGLPAVGDAGDRLSKQAEKHTVWMAKSRTLSR